MLLYRQLEIRWWGGESKERDKKTVEGLNLKIKATGESMMST